MYIKTNKFYKLVLEQHKNIDTPTGRWVLLDLI